MKSMYERAALATVLVIFAQYPLIRCQPDCKWYPRLTCYFDWVGPFCGWHSQNWTSNQNHALLRSFDMSGSLTSDFICSTTGYKCLVFSFPLHAAQLAVILEHVDGSRMTLWNFTDDMTMYWDHRDYSPAQVSYYNAAGDQYRIIMHATRKQQHFSYMSIDYTVLHDWHCELTPSSATPQTTTTSTTSTTTTMRTTASSTRQPVTPSPHTVAATTVPAALFTTDSKHTTIAQATTGVSASVHSPSFTPKASGQKDESSTDTAIIVGAVVAVVVVIGTVILALFVCIRKRLLFWGRRTTNESSSNNHVLSKTSDNETRNFDPVYSIAGPVAPDDYVNNTSLDANSATENYYNVIGSTDASLETRVKPTAPPYSLAQPPSAGIGQQRKEQSTKDNVYEFQEMHTDDAHTYESSTDSDDHKNRDLKNRRNDNQRRGPFLVMQDSRVYYNVGPSVSTGGHHTAQDGMTAEYQHPREVRPKVHASHTQADTQHTLVEEDAPYNPDMETTGVGVYHIFEAGVEPDLADDVQYYNVTGSRKDARRTHWHHDQEDDYKHLDFEGREGGMGGTTSHADVYSHLNEGGEGTYSAINRDKMRRDVLDGEYSHIA